MTVKRPTGEQFEIAIAWLECNEAESGGEREACEAVARWLEKEEYDHFVRSEARKVGVPAAVLRRRLAKREAV